MNCKLTHKEYYKDLHKINQIYTILFLEVHFTICRNDYIKSIRRHTKKLELDFTFVFCFFFFFFFLHVTVFDELRNVFNKFIRLTKFGHTYTINIDRLYLILTTHSVWLGFVSSWFSFRLDSNNFIFILFFISFCRLQYMEYKHTL